MDETKHPQSQQGNKESAKAGQAPKSAPVPGTTRRIFAKRWVYPAVYLGAAALIIGLMYIKSQTGTSPVTSTSVDPGLPASTQAAAQFVWPVADGVKPNVTLGYFNDKAPEKAQAAALVHYADGYYAHAGYDIQSSDKKPFAVVAATGGKVTAVADNPVYGQSLEVQSAGGYVERYESLSAVKVKAGDAIQQGQVIGISGTCDFEQSQGNHLYFEVRKDNQPVDPASVLPKQ